MAGSYSSSSCPVFFSDYIRPDYEAGLRLLQIWSCIVHQFQRCATCQHVRRFHSFSWQIKAFIFKNSTFQPGLAKSLSGKEETESTNITVMHKRGQQLTSETAWLSLTLLFMVVVQGANASCHDKKSSPALHVAAANGRVDCLHLLVEHGANVNQQDMRYVLSIHSNIQPADVWRWFSTHLASDNIDSRVPSEKPTFRV